MIMFLKGSHTVPCITETTFLSILVWTIFRWCVPGLNNPGVVAFLFRLLLTVGFFICSYKYNSNIVGLYIKDTCIYYKVFWEKKIDPQKITAIKIARATVIGDHRGEGIELSDRNKKPLYSMILVKGSLEEVDLIDDLKRDKTDYWFERFNSRKIICSCIYDQSAIDYLLTLNPNIIVF